MYTRKRKIYKVNFNDETWDSIGHLLNTLGTQGMSDNETNNELGHLIITLRPFGISIS
jgi:hypothetical protein